MSWWACKQNRLSAQVYSQNHKSFCIMDPSPLWTSASLSGAESQSLWCSSVDSFPIRSRFNSTVTVSFQETLKISGYYASIKRLRKIHAVGTYSCNKIHQSNEIWRFMESFSFTHGIANKFIIIKAFLEANEVDWRHSVLNNSLDGLLNTRTAVVGCLKLSKELGERGYPLS